VQESSFPDKKGFVRKSDGLHKSGAQRNTGMIADRKHPFSTFFFLKFRLNNFAAGK